MRPPDYSLLNMSERGREGEGRGKGGTGRGGTKEGEAKLEGGNEVGEQGRKEWRERTT